MQRILARIAQHARTNPNRPALSDTLARLSYGELQASIVDGAMQLPGERVALLMENSCAWAIVDLAIQQRGATCIPIPPFFTAAQIAHLISDAAPDLIVTDRPERIAALLHRSSTSHIEVAGRALALFKLPSLGRRELPRGTAKITYTSGTTGQPKGVCLSGEAIARASTVLSHAIGATTGDRTLSLLPLATLLENIGGIYAPLYSAAAAALPDLAECGISGSSDVQPGKLVAAFHRFSPTATILVPQLLKLLVESVAAGAVLPATLRFMAVGGAPCSKALLEQARDQSLPVFEGYGLSEAASVVSLNRPDDARRASVGRPLPHLQVRIADDGEIVVAGDLFLGYLGDAPADGGEWRTGDLGHLDDEGYLYVTGRKKSAYATAYGRKVSPEWVESELTGSRAVLQAAVFGEGRSCNVAVLFPRPGSSAAEVAAAVAAANARLPDYARIREWCLAPAPFSTHNGLARAPGSLDRAAIAGHYAEEIEKLYTSGERQHVAV